MGRVDLDSAVDRAQESHRWATAEAKFVPLSTREHYGHDFPDLIGELRVARHALDLLRPARAKVHQILDDDGFNATLPSSVRQRLRQVHADLDGALAAYDRHVQHLDDPGSERDGE